MAGPGSGPRRALVAAFVELRIPGLGRGPAPGPASSREAHSGLGVGGRSAPGDDLDGAGRAPHALRGTLDLDALIEQAALPAA